MHFPIKLRHKSESPNNQISEWKMFFKREKLNFGLSKHYFGKTTGLKL